MAHPKVTRDTVRRAFVYDRLSLEVSALKAGVSYATAARWKSQSAKDGDDWDKAQAAQLLSGGGIENIARQMLAGLVMVDLASPRGAATTSDCDSGCATISGRRMYR